MAMQRRFKVDHEDVFPCGAYLVSPVVPVFDFDRSTKDNKIQQVDKDTGLLLWAVDVLDADPEAGRKPYIEESGSFSRIAWSFKAQGMTAPKSGAAAATAAAVGSPAGDGKAA